MDPEDFDIARAPRSEAEELAALRWIRENDPVRWNERHGWWLITKYADLKAVSKQPEIFSSRKRGPWIAFDSEWSIQADDGPGHQLTRRAVARGLTTRATKGFASRVERYADEAIDTIASAGRGDLVRDVAMPVPMRTISDLLGLERHALFVRWTEAVERKLENDATHAEADQAAEAEFQDYVSEIVELRIRQPTDDLISSMVAARSEGVFESFVRATFPGVPEGDGVMGFISFLVIAGNETTRHAISNGMRLLMTHPDQMKRLREDLSLLPSAVEEILRLSSPARAMQRTVLSETTLRGKTLREGDRVVMVYGSANRDEEVFEDAEAFRIDRTPNEHVTFGFGSHFCLGASLARMEIAGALRQLLTRLPDITLAPDSEPERLRSAMVNGLTCLPVVFTPSTR